jgi:hypothetical protein
MTRIESEQVEVARSSESIYKFLSDFNNFKSLMPEQVTNWSSTDSECSFTIKGMATIGMKIVEKIPHSLIKITSSGKVPFNFTLNVELNSIGDNKCNARLVFESDINPMMKMMVEKPLQNFFNLLVRKLKDLHV